MTAKKAAPATEKPEAKRAVLRMTEADFKRLRILLAKRELTWQELLTQAVNGWLTEEGAKELEDLQ